MEKNSFDDMILLTEITCENGKTYYLYNDGNLYEKSDDGNHKKLDKLNEGNLELIQKIMERFKPAKTDNITEPVTKRKRDNTVINVEPLELE